MALDALGIENKLFAFDCIESRLLQKDQRFKMRDDKSSKAGDSSALLNYGDESRHGLNSGARWLKSSESYKCSNL